MLVAIDGIGRSSEPTRVKFWALTTELAVEISGDPPEFSRRGVGSIPSAGPEFLRADRRISGDYVRLASRLEIDRSRVRARLRNDDVEAIDNYAQVEFGHYNKLLMKNGGLAEMAPSSDHDLATRGQEFNHPTARAL